MQITIDTNQDSHDDIKKVIQLLGHIIGHHTSVPTAASMETPAATEEQTTNMMSMFGNTTLKEDTAPDFSSFLNLADKENDDEPRIEIL